MVTPARIRTGVSAGAKRGDGMVGSLSQEEHERRRQIVEEAFLRTDSVARTCTMCAEIPGPPSSPIATIRLSMRTVKKYLAQTRELWEREGEPTRKQARARARRRILQRAERFETAGAHGPSASLERLLAQVEGTLAPQEVKVSKGGLDRLRELSDEELAKVRAAAELLGEGDAPEDDLDDEDDR